MNVRPAKKTTMFSELVSSPSKKRTRGGKLKTSLSDAPDDALAGACMHAVIACQDIKRGDEILMSYGDDYWASRPNIICVQCKEHQAGSRHSVLQDSDYESA